MLDFSALYKPTCKQICVNKACFLAEHHAFRFEHLLASFGLITVSKFMLKLINVDADSCT
jgi:hypothetical protein